ncbi:hypothetical protein [Streptomyces mayteni]
MIRHHPLPLARALAWGVPLGAAAALALAVLTGRAWQACDVGANAAANSWALLTEVLIGVGTVNAALFAATYLALPPRNPGRRLGTALAAWLPLTALVAWWYFAVHGTPADYPAPLCPENVPPWWPSAIPV